MLETNLRVGIEKEDMAFKMHIRNNKLLKPFREEVPVVHGQDIGGSDGETGVCVEIFERTSVLAEAVGDVYWFGVGDGAWEEDCAHEAHAARS